MATYARVDPSTINWQPLRRWRKRGRTITFGQAGDDWVIARSDWPWVAVFPAVLERDAGEFGDRLMRARGWVEVKIPELESAHGQIPADR